jgi:hypothetical protein
MTHDGMLEETAALALGILPEPARSAAIAHLDTCEECRREYAELRPAADLIGLSAETNAAELDDVASRRMRTALLSQIAPASRVTSAPGAPPRERPRSAVLAYLAAAAAIAIALISSLSNAALRSENAANLQRIATLEQQMNAQARAAEYDRAALADIFSSNSEHYQVKGGEVVRRGDKLYLTMWALPALPRGHVYQTWSRGAGKAVMTPGVTFRPNRDGFAIVRLPVSAASIDAVALSVEPEGGSKAPTTTPTFFQKLA